MKPSRGNWNRAIRRPSLEGLPPLSLASRFVLAELDQRQRRFGRIVASVRGLAEALETSPSSVAKALKQLVAVGLIRRTSTGLEVLDQEGTPIDPIEEEGTGRGTGRVQGRVQRTSYTQMKQM